MTNRERFQCMLKGKMPSDRLPMIEWAAWWNLTYDRWVKDGLPNEITYDKLFEHFGLDRHIQHWVAMDDGNCPNVSHGDGYVKCEKDYENIKKHLYPEQNLKNIDNAFAHLKEMQKQDIVIWFSLEGFFWFPRHLFGIEEHLYAFYDHPELMHRMNSDATQYYKKVLEIIYSHLTPDFMTFAEDMSYNNGPMLSKENFEEFLAPYYKQTVPLISSQGTLPVVDTDGLVEPLIPWLLDVGIKGILPLERQSLVDVARIKTNYPTLFAMGGFDKTVMKNGEAAMRKEFERLLPVMKKGGYIPAVDHQTPPDVSLENYKLYVKLLEEYCTKAINI